MSAGSGNVRNCFLVPNRLYLSQNCKVTGIREYFMVEQTQLSDLIDQEVDFIGQLFVEFEQLSAYPDILEAADKLRSLASLFFDFMERIHQALKHKEVTAGGAEETGPAGDLSVFPEPQKKILQPYFRFHRRYREMYPDKIDPAEIRKLFHHFPAAAETAASLLRQYSQNLRNADAR